MRQRLFAALFAATLAPHAFGQVTSCKVLDPEIVGRYSGGCKDGLAEGVGEASGQAEYRGEFVAGRKHGRGVMRWQDGERYEGGFAHDRRNGPGEFVWSNIGPRAGERYVGIYRDDLRHGFGEQTWGSGERYSGSWTDDQPDGPLSASMISRARARAESEAALVAPGTSACREVAAGIAVRAWVRATVLEVVGGRVSLRIDQPGLPGLTLRGVSLERGVVLRDDVLAWVPCK